LLNNHAKAIVACDFFLALTATFRMLHVFVVIEHGSRPLLRVAVTAYPSAEWTSQQLREVIGYEDRYRYLIHDRDNIFAKRLDESIRALGLRVLKSPPHCPKANSVCERVIATIRRECLDWLIPMSEPRPSSSSRAGPDAGMSATGRSWRRTTLRPSDRRLLARSSRVRRRAHQPILLRCVRLTGETD